MQSGGKTLFVQTAEHAANPWVRVRASDVENVTSISEKRLRAQSRNLGRSCVEYISHHLERIVT